MAILRGVVLELAQSERNGNRPGSVTFWLFEIATEKGPS
jgi:hypothetical protein